MSNSDFWHYEWTMPGGIPNGPKNPIKFSFIRTNLLLENADPLINSLKAILSDQNTRILSKALGNLLKHYGPKHEHAIVFVSAPNTDLLYLQAGAMILFDVLRKKWATITISVIPLHWEVFEFVRNRSIKGGFTSAEYLN